MAQLLLNILLMKFSQLILLTLLSFPLVTQAGIPQVSLNGSEEESLDDGSQDIDSDESLSCQAGNPFTVEVLYEGQKGKSDRYVCTIQRKNKSPLVCNIITKHKQASNIIVRKCRAES